MKNIKIVKQKLTHGQIGLLTTEIINSPNITYIRPDYWLKIPTYLIFADNEFAGACGLVFLKNNWKKIGPIVVVGKFRNHSLGQKLLRQILLENKNTNLFIHTTNPAVVTILNKLNFSEIKKLYKLPKEVFPLILTHIIDNMSWRLLKYSLAKRKRAKAKNFVLYAKSFKID